MRDLTRYKMLRTSMPFRGSSDRYRSLHCRGRVRCSDQNSVLIGQDGVCKEPDVTSLAYLVSCRIESNVMKLVERLHLKGESFGCTCQNKACKHQR